jgi:hypothetical protein
LLVVLLLFLCPRRPRRISLPCAALAVSDCFRYFRSSNQQIRSLVTQKRKQRVRAAYVAWNDCLICTLDCFLVRVPDPIGSQPKKLQRDQSDRYWPVSKKKEASGLAPARRASGVGRAIASLGAPRRGDRLWSSASSGLFFLGPISS